jgi:pimeloyl-ACP methyl ester carboxylesterase
MRIPPKTKPLQLDRLTVQWHGYDFSLPYFYREGSGGPRLLMVHGLGGSKENFYAAFQSPALASCTLVAFDEPGTGQAAYDCHAGLDVSALADLAQQVAEHLLEADYFLAGASMGGLIALLQLRKHGLNRIQGLVNIEGNLCPEDCMFSRRAVAHALADFGPVFEIMMRELQASPLVGDRLIAQNMALNVDSRAYHAYSFQTVAESDSGRLIEEFLSLPIPRLFLHGEGNRHLSYLPRLDASAVRVREIPCSGHFLFYDNPIATFEAIGEFMGAVSSQREAK